MTVTTRYSTGFASADEYDRLIPTLPSTPRDYFLPSQQPVGQPTAFTSSQGTGSLTQTTGQPTRVVRDVSGIRELYLNADGLIYTGFPTAQPFTMAMAAKFSAAPASNKTALDSNVGLRRDTLGRLFPNGLSGSVTAATSGGWQTVVQRVNGASSSLRLDGVATTYTAGSTVPDHYYVGTGSGDVFSVRCIAFFDAALTDVQIAAIEKHLRRFHIG